MGKLCTDQMETLIDKLVTSFSGILVADIDDAVAQAKNLLTAKQNQARWNDLKRLFDIQIATLKDRGTPEQIVVILQNQRCVVLDKGFKIWATKYPNETLESLAAQGIYISLPVIPRSYRGIHDLMAMVRNGSKEGYTYLNPGAISDVVDAPQEPYYIYDVEDGNSTRDKSPQDAEKILKKQSRSPLTAAEVTAPATGPPARCRLCTSTAAVARSSTGAVSTTRVSAGGRPPAVVARALAFGPSGLLVLWPLASAAIFSTGRFMRPRTHQG